jgi:hypothetical protein
MNLRYSWLLMGVVAASFCGAAAAQDSATRAQPPATPAQTAAPAAKPAAKSTAQIDAGEPRANTSGALTPSAPASSGSPAKAPANASNETATLGSGPPAAPKAASKGAPAAQKAPGAADRLNLGTATVTGDREQPKVMYIVPWKKSDIGDLSGKPMNSLLDEALAPVDRDEFKREVAYFDAVKADTSQNHAPNGAAKQVEK